MSRDAKSWLALLGLAALEVTTARAAGLCPVYLQFLQSKCAQWQSSVLPKTLPAARGNAFADSEPAAAFGMKVFYDNRFSQSGTGVACASCHDPEHAFAEVKPTSHTIKQVDRNAPDLINAAWYTRFHFWDGKVDNLWSAPLYTFEQDAEMGSSRLAVAHTAASIYKIRYEKIFGPMPDLGDPARFPATGKPGMRQFDVMSPQDKELVNQVYVNVGKALEAYVRKLAAGRAAFDDFMNGSQKAISPDAQRGMVAFTKHGCDGCHSGPTFTDEGFHDLRYPAGSATGKDRARAGGVAFSKDWQFSSAGKFADPAEGATAVATAVKAGEPKGFRTPSLRNVELTFPYGHDGRFGTLEQVIEAHRGVMPDHEGVNEQDQRDLIAFLHTLTGRPPQAPWNYWPGG